jgi:hypothetical protein
MSNFIKESCSGNAMSAAGIGSPQCLPAARSHACAHSERERMEIELGTCLKIWIAAAPWLFGLAQKISVVH